MARACGKAILLGEHAVVHGVPALVVGLERGVEAIARRSTDSTSVLYINGGPPILAGDSEIGGAFQALLDACNPGFPVQIELMSTLPIGAGVGSSAAMGVAAVRALATLTGHLISPELEQQRALAWERIFHGNPSGIDTAAASYGGCLRYTRGVGVERISLREPLTFVLGYCGYGSSTRAMVERVAEYQARQPQRFAEQLSAIHELVDSATIALHAGNLLELGHSMDQNQEILTSWGLSTTELDTLRELAKNAGALGTKLTGAGGGGCVIALCDGNPASIVSAWQSAGFSAFTASISP